MKNDEQVEVFREHLEECLRHFGERITSAVKQRSRNAAIFRRPMAEFLGVTDGTVQRLLYGLGPLPTGENRIKLMFYLDLHGYRVIELEQMRRTKILGNFAELLGYSVFPAIEASRFIGFYTKGSRGNNNDVSHLYRVLRGGVGIAKDKEDRMWDIWKTHRNDLERKKKEAAEKYKLQFSSLSVAKPAIEATNKVNLVTLPCKATLTIMDGLLGLLRENPFEVISEKDMMTIRTVYGSNILELSARISALGAKLIKSEKEATNGQ